MSGIIITTDGVLDIATGRSRKETNWKNKEVTWSELVKKLSVTHRTAETHGEYITAKKTRQDELKDVGGFVGGHLASGRRKATSVVHRQILTLDIDFAGPSLWEDFTMLYDYAALIYSTHKHSPDKPRLRMLIPLDRPVFSDEYQAIARRIAGNIGIDYFDHTTFEPSRLMYWPSTSKDGEYVFQYQDGPWLSADSILKSYRDWKDSSEWPVSERYYNIIQKSIAKQGDPLEKPGVIGAFCRTYSIDEAIETLLQDTYEHCDLEGRYTYKEGSTAAGLVVYENKYAYSHHGTDPVSGKLCNAFDLVRIHRFGLQDEDAKEGTPGNKLPSYTAMIELAIKDVKVRRLMGAERLSDAKTDFEIEVDQLDPGNDEWLGTLAVDKKMHYYSTIDNMVIILENDPVFRSNIAFDVFEQRSIFRRNLPWRKVEHSSRYMTDRDDANIEHYLEKTYEIVSSTKLEKALSVVYEKTKFHPIRDYLNSVSWDGQPRCDTLFIEYMGAEDSAYTRAVTRKTLVAAVARVFQPGIKFDYMLTFVGTQGLGKSSIIGKLGKQWFSDSIHTVQGKEAYEAIQGVWLAEMAELSGIKKADVEVVKSYISKREDRFRVAYGRRVENFPRQCIFLGSTNKNDFLFDPTGNRRFWPIALDPEAATKWWFTDLTDYEIDQVWAEAVTHYNKGETLYLSKEIEQEAREAQKEHSEVDDRAGIIESYINRLLPENWNSLDVYERRSFLQGDELLSDGVEKRYRVCAAEIWCEAMGGMQKEMNGHNTRFIHNIMRNMEGWKEYKSRTIFPVYGNQKGYFREEKKALQRYGNPIKVLQQGKN